MSNPDPEFKLLTHLSSSAASTTAEKAGAEEAGRAANAPAKVLHEPTRQTCQPQSRPAIAEPSQTKTPERFLLSGSIPSRRRGRAAGLTRQSKGFINIPLLRLVVVPSAARASAGNNLGRIGG